MYYGKRLITLKDCFLFISGFFAGVLFISGTLFKIQHWSGAGWLLLLACLSGILFFLPALTISKFREQGNIAKRPVYILGAIGIILYTSGLLFKIQHWPFATIPALTISRITDQENRSKRPVYILGASVLFFTLPGCYSKFSTGLCNCIMVTGVLISGVIALPWYTWLTWKDDDNVSARFIYIISVLSPLSSLVS